MNVFDLSAKIAMDINGYLKGMDQAKAVAISTMGIIGEQISGFMTQSVEVGKGFDRSMSQVAATMGNTMDEMGNEVGSVQTQFGSFSGTLREFAQYMGSNTAFSATQAADALNYMALAGYNTQQSMEMLPNVLNLAAAGGFDLARASDMVTDTQTAFGITSKRTTQMVDEMAKAASTGNTSVEQLGDAFLTVGGLAKELNGGMVTLSDGTTASTDGVQELEIALTAMANAGVKGSEAGTHMRNMLMKLSSPTAEGAKQMEKLGVNVFDANGKMRSLSDIFGELNTSMSTLTQEEKIQAISDLFNARDLSSAEALLAAVSQDWDHIGEAILNAEGAAGQMAETQLDNLAGDITLLQSATEGFQIALSDAATPALREMTQFGTEVVQDLTDAFLALPEPVQTAIGAIGMFGGQIASYIPSVGGLVTSLTQMSSAAKIAGDATGGFAGKLMTGLSSPVFLAIVGGIAAAVAALVTFENNVKANTEAVREFKGEADRISEATSDAAKSVEELAGYEERSVDAAAKAAQAQQNLAALQEAQAKAADMAAEAQAHLSGEVSDGAVELDTAAEIFTGFIGSTYGVGIQIQTMKERMEGYSQSAEEMQQAQEEANAAINAAQNEVAMYNLLAQDMNDYEREATEVALSFLDVKNMEPEAYQAACDSIQQLNEAHQEETAIALQTMDEIIEQMKLVEAEYEQAYQAAYDNLTNTMGLFDTITVEVDQSVTDMIASLDSQIKFMDNYSANMDKAAKLGIDEGLLKRLSDGSVESAKILQAIVDDGGEHIDELNKKFNNVEEGKQNLSSKMAEVNTDFDEKMKKLDSSMEETMDKLDKADKAYANGIKTVSGFSKGSMEARDSIYAQYTFLAQDATAKLDQSGKAYGSGLNTIQGAINGAEAMRSALTAKYASLADSATSAYNSHLQIESPSKVFRRSGIYTIQGAIEGAESERQNLETAYSELAQTAVDAYNNNLTDLNAESGGLEYEDTDQPVSRGNQITMNVYGAQGQDVNALAEIVIQRLMAEINTEVAVYA